MKNTQNNTFDKQFKSKEELQAYMIDVKKKSKANNSIGYSSKLLLS